MLGTWNESAAGAKNTLRDVGQEDYYADMQGSLVIVARLYSIIIRGRLGN